MLSKHSTTKLHPQHAPHLQSFYFEAGSEFPRVTQICDPLVPVSGITRITSVYDQNQPELFFSCEIAACLKWRTELRVLLSGFSILRGNLWGTSGNFKTLWSTVLNHLALSFQDSVSSASRYAFVILLLPTCQNNNMFTLACLQRLRILSWRKRILATHLLS